ncbi:hypothetical protein E4U09_003633 [Claviceps aff. purpurea]|uniref:Uncharacterized protein n=1 Tax=Claviceps aff. purpurea TaxID=1967640 RepID=A0A9P7U1X4_9HYPO|nr:hypothetical protein E4U09_003633 [Claviceps aff. purpurea]
MTASAADLHWPCLLRYSKDYDAWKKADSTQRIEIARKFLRENPHLATEHFQNSFFRIVLEGNFGYTDYWIRYETTTRAFGTTPDGDKPRSDAGSRAYDTLVPKSARSRLIAIVRVPELLLENNTEEGI